MLPNKNTWNVSKQGSSIEQVEPRELRYPKTMLTKAHYNRQYMIQKHKELKRTEAEKHQAVLVKSLRYKKKRSSKEGSKSPPGTGLRSYFQTESMIDRSASAEQVRIRTETGKQEEVNLTNRSMEIE